MPNPITIVDDKAMVLLSLKKKLQISSAHADPAAIQGAREKSELGASIRKPWKAADLVGAIKGPVGE